MKTTLFGPPFRPNNNWLASVGTPHRRISGGRSIAVASLQQPTRGCSDQSCIKRSKGLYFILPGDAKRHDQSLALFKFVSSALRRSQPAKRRQKQKHGLRLRYGEHSFMGGT